MLSFVVRLLPDRTDGELVGEVENVATGEHTVVRSAADLLGWLTHQLRPLRLLPGQSAEGDPPSSA